MILESLEVSASTGTLSSTLEEAEAATAEAATAEAATAEAATAAANAAFSNFFRCRLLFFRLDFVIFVVPRDLNVLDPLRTLNIPVVVVFEFLFRS